MSTIAEEHDRWAAKVSPTERDTLDFYCGAAAALFSLRDAGVKHEYLTHLLAEVDEWFRATDPRLTNS